MPETGKLSAGGRSGRLCLERAGNGEKMRLSSTGPRLGAHFNAQGTCEFLLWAPYARKVVLSISHPMPLEVEMRPAEAGYFFGEVKDLPPDSRYQYRIYPQGAPEGADPLMRPDPASRSQPDGVHGPSQVVHDHFQWQDVHWHGLPLTQYIIYEAHVGTMTEEGTFNSLIARLDDLKRLGITALELMPVAQFPGTRNWGYDGVYPFAAQSSYGGAARAQAAGGCVSSQWDGGYIGCGLQPSRARRQLPGRFRSLLHRCLSNPLGCGDQL
jgi:1,4-alpha-glucan branching enzyme